MMLRSLIQTPISVLTHLCVECQHGNDCPGPEIVPAAAGGLSCAAYRPTPDRKQRLKDEHILALPDREPCRDCATVKGSVPNGTPHSIADFAMCVREKQPFLCHHDGHGRICAGWLRAVKARIAIEDAEVLP